MIRLYLFFVTFDNENEIQMKYAEVILPLPIENSYTYSVPSDLEAAVKTGCRVIVHFGKKRYYTAIVMEVHERRPDTRFETKDIYAFGCIQETLKISCIFTLKKVLMP